MINEEKEFDLINYDDYKSYYQDTSKEEILYDTWLDYCAYRNIIEKNTELQSQLDIANKKLDEIEEYIKDKACYDEKTKECKCSFSSMALDNVLSIIGGE